MNFMESLESNIINSNKTLTENGAIAFSSYGKAICDFNFDLVNLRQSSYNKIGERFAKIYFQEGANIAIKYWFWIMDTVEGAGERNITKGIMFWLIDTHPEIIEAFMEYIPDFNRWDTAIMLCDPLFNKNEKLRLKAINFVHKQFVADLKAIPQKKSISLLGKWMPSENASSQETKRKARQLMYDLNIKPRTYRRGLSVLRAKLHVVERDMSSNNWNKINYEFVPSKANLIYSNAFMRHDEERRREYLESLKKGETKINAKVLAPYEIVKAYGSYRVKGTVDEALEQMWKNLPQYELKNTLVVRDGSGSMNSTINNTKVSCLDVATALAIYSSEHNTGIWKDKFITFSNEPKFVNLKNCKTLRDKIQYCEKFDDCENTNIYSTMKLILNTAVSNGYSQKDMPRNILIISDMQFDTRDSYFRWKYGIYSGAFNYDKTLFQKIQREYAAKGYKLPKIIFWNLDNRWNKTIPLTENELGLSLVSGFSANIFKLVMSNELDPYKQLISILNSDRYSFIDKIVTY